MVCRSVRADGLLDLHRNPLPDVVPGTVMRPPRATTTSLNPPMSDENVQASKRVLEPMDHISEVLFGLIMVLTFTGSLSVAEAGRLEIRTMLIGALGCNRACRAPN